jgi:hypothetical protein
VCNPKNDVVQAFGVQSNIFNLASSIELSKAVQESFAGFSAVVHRAVSSETLAQGAAIHIA